MNKRELKRYFIENYISSGFMYDGSIPANADIFYNNENNYKLALKLEKERFLQIRECEGYSFELTRKIRKNLFIKHNLREVWNKEHPEFYPDIIYYDLILGLNYWDEMDKKQIEIDKKKAEKREGNETVWIFNSSSSNRQYKVKYKKYNDYYILSCSCPSWIFNHNNRHCKHTDQVEKFGYRYQLPEFIYFKLFNKGNSYGEN